MSKPLWVPLPLPSEKAWYIIPSFMFWIPSMYGAPFLVKTRQFLPLTCFRPSWRSLQWNSYPDAPATASNNSSWPFRKIYFALSLGSSAAIKISRGRLSSRLAKDTTPGYFLSVAPPSQHLTAGPLLRNLLLLRLHLQALNGVLQRLLQSPQTYPFS